MMFLRLLEVYYKKNAEYANHFDRLVKLEA